MGRKDDHSFNGGIGRTLVEFLEVAVTSIVFLKGLYPSGAFERRRYMNLVVQRAYHPELRHYIHSAVWGLLPFIEKVYNEQDIEYPQVLMLNGFYEISNWHHDLVQGEFKRSCSLKLHIFFWGMVERVAVIFFNTANIPVERFVFKLAVNPSYDTDTETDLELSLRTFLIKLSVSEPLTRVLSQDCRWEISGYFRSVPEAGTSKESELWGPAETKQWEQPPSITPIKSISSEPLSLQLYLEHPIQVVSMIQGLESVK